METLMPSERIMLKPHTGEATPVAEARAAMLAAVRPIAEQENLPIKAALCRVLSEEVRARVNVPPHDNSAMDGFALNGGELKAGKIRLRIVGTALAGKAFTGSVGTGGCVRIMTGAVMPAECDTVIPHELVIAISDDHIEFDAIVLRAGANRRCAGEDVKAGSIAVPIGKRLMPADLGLFASIGIEQVQVTRRLRVAYFSTGDELCAPGEALRPGCIYDSNRFTLHGLIVRAGHEPLDMGVIPDHPEQIEQALRTACTSSDAVVIVGGMSEGDADHTRHMLARLGKIVFHKLAMRPGRPMAFGAIRSEDHEAFLFGLPGNPVAAMVSFYFFVAPALEKMAGGQQTPLSVAWVPSAQTIKKRAGRTEFQRGVVESDELGHQHVRINDNQGSGVLRSMSEANCIIVLDHDQAEVKAGDWVKVLYFHGLV